MASPDENKAVVRRFYEEAYNQKREAVLDEIISPDYLDKGHNPPGQGIEGARQDLRGILAAFEPVHFAIEQLIAEGDTVAVRWTGSGVQVGEFGGMPATGQPMEFSGMSFYRLADGKLVETRNAVNL
ncbi:MAG: ester cyclase [Aphanocapsa lilacina HA4352-LM1]|jgi:predicted ester cyclase|nr:ester cyclase [Aphanocapsa lilacina HA4352-LM1]